MKWGITGAGGMLALDLQETLISANEDVIAWRRVDLDITNFEQLRNVLSEAKPDIIVNCAAFTQVDDAEIIQGLAFSINTFGAKYLSQICDLLKIRLIHISTDFVFDGFTNTPYQTQAKTNPLNLYGQSKLRGEEAVLKETLDSLVLRISWLYGKHGANFVKTMLKLASHHHTLKVVADQNSSPTWTKDVADALLKLGKSEVKGILHYSNTGVCSWYSFACEIFEQAMKLGLIQQIPEVLAIPSQDYPTSARRPLFSALDTSDYSQMFGEPPHWKESLAKALALFT